MGLGGDLGNRRQGAGINMYINNNLGFIFLGDMGGLGGVGIKVHIDNHLGFIFLGDIGGDMGGTVGQGDRV